MADHLEDAGRMWSRCLSSLDGTTGSTHRAWLAQTRALSIIGDQLVLAVPDEFIKDWVEHRIVPGVLDPLTRVAGRPMNIRVTVRELPDEDQENAPDQAQLQQEDRDRDAAQGAETRIPGGPLRQSGRMQPDGPQLNPKYTFDRFVIGQSNRFAHAAAVAVAEAPAKSYNPLFIYGAAGLGKTHLLHAIGHYVGSMFPRLRIRYISSEQFTNDFINAIRDERAGAFQRRYRDNDVLLIDDIQFLAGKERTQEEFFHTFNALHNAEKQIVISSDRPPKQIATLEDRLRSRFEWGLITDIQPPDLETRIAILRKKCAADRLAAPDDVLSYIASKIQSNIRELEGALIRVTAFASLNRSSVDLPLTQVVLKDIFPDEGGREVSVALIMAETADHFELSVDDLTGPKRSQKLVNARQIAMYLTRELTDLSLPKIGQAFGGRDHTTVMHAGQKIRRRMQEQRSTYNQVQELTSRIKVRSQEQQ